MITKAKTFLTEVYEEFTKVTWLKREDVVKSTIAISIFVIIVSIYISIVDFGLSKILGNFLGGR